jgi:hypothetical protein
VVSLSKTETLQNSQELKGRSENFKNP